MNLNVTTSTIIGSSNVIMNPMESITNEVYENLNKLYEGVKKRNQLTQVQNYISESNDNKLKISVIAKNVILGAIMVAQVYILKYFINRKH